MALTCGFFNSVDGDRKYDATQFASLFDGVITDGVVAAVGDFFATTPGGGMVVNVGSGRAWFNRTWTYSDAKIPLTLDASDLLYDRIDAVVLEIDTSVMVRDNSIKVLKGTPAQEPVKPVLTNEGDIHQYALAYVRVKASSIEIGAGDITINVGQADCPFVTSIVETPELEVLFAQWDAQFTEWFENVQSQLEGDVATNLQRQIDDHWSKTLSDETKTLMGLSLDKNPDDAFRSLFLDDKFSIGDIKYTVRNDLGEEWVLCNGSRLSRESYEELSSFYPSLPNSSWSNDSMLADISCFMHGLAYGNSEYIACGYYSGTYANQTKLIISYGSNIASNFSYSYLDNTIYALSNCTDVVFAQGVFVVACWTVTRTDSGAPNIASIYYGPNHSSLKKQAIWSGTYSGGVTTIINRIRFINNYFVVIGKRNNKGVLKYSSDAAVSWSDNVTIPLTDPKDIFYANGIYVVVGYSTTSGNVIAYSENLNGPWTTVTPTNLSSISSNVINVVFFKGNWVFLFQQHGILYTDDLEKNTWSYTAIPITMTYDMTVNNDCIAVIGSDRQNSNRHSYVGYSTDLINFPMTSVYVDNSGQDFNTITYINKNFVIYGSFYEPSNDPSRASKKRYIDDSTLQLPNVSSSGQMYAYIKAKEANLE